MTSTPGTFSSQLRGWRLERGLTQALLAQKASVPQPNLCNLEMGKADPSLATLRRLAEALNLSVGRLVDEAPPVVDLGRHGLDALVRASLGIASKERAPEALVRQLRSVFVNRNRVLGGTRGGVGIEDKARTERRLRAELGRSQWQEVVRRSEKLAGSLCGAHAT